MDMAVKTVLPKDYGKGPEFAPAVVNLCEILIRVFLAGTSREWCC